MKDEIIGYVICVSTIATNDNPNFAGTKETDYVGRNYTYLGDYNFKPYATEKSAKNAIKTWKKRFEHPGYNNGWTHTIEKVMPLTKQTIKQLETEIEAQRNRAFAAMKNILDEEYTAMKDIYS